MLDPIYTKIVGVTFRNSAQDGGADKRTRASAISQIRSLRGAWSSRIET